MKPKTHKDKFHRLPIGKQKNHESSAVVSEGIMALVSAGMITPLSKAQGSWSQVKGKARRLWGDLTDDDLNVAEGSYEELIARIQSKSGEGLDSIRMKLFHE